MGKTVYSECSTSKQRGKKNQKGTKKRFQHVQIEKRQVRQNVTRHYLPSAWHWQPAAHSRLPLSARVMCSGERRFAARLRSRAVLQRFGLQGCLRCVV